MRVTRYTSRIFHCHLRTTIMLMMTRKMGRGRSVMNLGAKVAEHQVLTRDISQIMKHHLQGVGVATPTSWTRPGVNLRGNPKDHSHPCPILSHLMYAGCV